MSREGKEALQQATCLLRVIMACGSDIVNFSITLTGQDRAEGGRATSQQQQHRRLPRKSTRHDLLEASDNILQVSKSTTSKKNTYPMHDPTTNPAPVLSTGYRAMHDVGSAGDATLTTPATLTNCSRPAGSRSKRKRRAASTARPTSSTSGPGSQLLRDAPSLRRVREANSHFHNLCSAKEVQDWLEDASARRL